MKVALNNIIYHSFDPSKKVLKMKLRLVFILLAIVFSSCSTINVIKVNWEGKLISDAEEIDYLYWNDGNQFITRHQDSTGISVAGFEYDYSLYILLSIHNETKYPITFRPSNCSLNYTFANEEINLSPVKPKNFDKGHYSFFNTILDGANDLSKLFLSVPIDAIFGGDNEAEDSPNSVVAEYQDDIQNMSHKIFINNHTLFPETHYAGFLVFELDEEKPLQKEKFTLSFNIGADFVVSGYLSD
ncbi:hypothetical protein ACFLTH_07430 [Bacteroidota bacterium]